MADRTGGETEAVDRLLDSTLDSVDRAEELALQVAQSAGVEEDDLHRLAMAVRETMVNAVVHGNRYSAHKKVHFLVSKDRGQLRVVVRDQGEGFDVSKLPDPLAEENLLRNSGRGMFLIRAFMDEVQVRRLQPQGTEVTLVKNLVSK